MQAVSFDETLERLVQSDARYHRQAYVFLREALEHTQKKLGKPADGTIHHVTGQQLLGGLREYALQKFGPMTMFVFSEWGVQRCEDWGEIVFTMIEQSLFLKTDKDSRDDFKGGYDFFEAFRQPFCPSAPKCTEAQPQTQQQL